MKTAITIVNIISAIPILLYPFIFIPGIMSFDTPGSIKSIGPWIIFILSLIYPIILITLIIISRKHNSLLIALLATIPVLILLFIFIIDFHSPNKENKNNFNTLNRDFICDSNSFLNLNGDGENNAKAKDVLFLEKKNLFSFKENKLAEVFGKDKINFNNFLNHKEVKDKPQDLLKKCKNKDGKSVMDLYPNVISDEEVNDLFKNVFNN